jgi:hypothetical protein
LKIGGERRKANTPSGCACHPFMNKGEYILSGCACHLFMNKGEDIKEFGWSLNIDL